MGKHSMAYFSSNVIKRFIKPRSESLKAPAATNGDERVANSFAMNASAARAAEVRMVVSEAEALYENMDLEKEGLDEKAFEYAWRGYYNLLKKGLIHKKSVLSICDFSQSSSNKRM